jgi:NAD(P)-dependent dehydrogenase (short-subunit alcohol dehydrogenase family)
VGSDMTGDGQMRFDGRVAVVTGAGNGLGRAYALAFAARGASVVVNDLGVALDGSSQSTAPAAQVVSEITAGGGIGVANTSDVSTPEGGHDILRTALEHFGRLDVLVNNAGVVDTGDFQAGDQATTARVISTNLMGAFNVTRPALKVMQSGGYGRVIMTSSGAVFGSREGVAYQAAKSGLIAFTRAMAQIGAPDGVLSNAVLPTAFTRMTSGITDPGFRAFMEERFTPERVAAAVVLLGHESTTVTGECFLAGGGRLARLFLGVTAGYISEDPSPEDFREHLSQAMTIDGFTVPASRIEEFQSYLPLLGYGASLADTLVAKSGD